MKSQKRVIASMLAAVIVLTLLIVFPHAETAGQNSCDSCTESGSSQSSVLEKAFGMRQTSSTGQASAVVQNSRSKTTSKASQNISSGKTSSAIPVSSASQNNSSGLTSSAGKNSSAKETPKNSGPVSQGETMQSAAPQKTLLTNAEISPQTIADGLGTASDFAVFARKFTLRSHMEGNVAVQTFAATTGNIGNSADVYTHKQNSNTFDLTISISGIAKHHYTVGIYTDVAATPESKVQEISLPTTDSSGKAAGTAHGLDSTKVYYAYLLDDNEKPIVNGGTSQQGITGGGSVVYSGNDSYIQTLTDPDDPTYKLPINWDLFQKAMPGSTVMPLSATFGNTYLLYNPNVSTAPQTTGDGNCILVNSKTKEEVIHPIGGGVDNTVSIKGTFPFVFKDVFKSLSSLSNELAGTQTSQTMRVINVAPSGNDDALKDALITALGYHNDPNALTNPEKAIQLGPSQYLVINVNCGTNTSVTIPPCFIGKVDYGTHWNDISSRILWNFYGGSKTLTVKTTTGVLGTILAPLATVNYDSTIDGAIYADTVYNVSGEIHKMTFRPTRSISFTDHSTPPFTLPETGGSGTGFFYLAGGGVIFLAAVAVLIHSIAKQGISAKGRQLFDHIGVFLQKHSLSIYPQRTENDSS